MPERANQKHVAKLAGVSLMTVSRTFSNRESVAPLTRQKVLAAARELGFTPNLLARNLRQGTTRTVGALISLCHPWFGARYMRHLSWSLLGKGYSCQLVDSMSDPELILRALEDFHARRVSLVLLECRNNIFAEKKICRMLKLFPAVVLISHAEFSEDEDLSFADKILWTPVPALEESLQFLQKQRRQKILGCTKFRNASLLRIWEKNNFDFMDMPERDWQKDPLHETRFLEENYPGKLPFDVIFSKVDETAVTMINYLQKRGVRVPEDVAVIGYNNNLPEGISPIPLASVDWNLDEMTKVIEKTVLHRLKNPDAPPVLEKVNYRFIPRRSCGA